MYKRGVTWTLNPSMQAEEGPPENQKNWTDPPPAGIASRKVMTLLANCLRVWGFRFGVWVSRFRACGLWCRVYGLLFKVWDLWLVTILGFRV